jgi:SAM-dependent methyltransferase
LWFELGRAADRAARLLHYLGAGTLSLADLQDGIRRGWQDHYGREADVPAGLMPWEEELVARFVPSGADVLLIGCGSGRDVVALGARGCRVIGIDPSARALRTARQAVQERGVTAEFVEGFFEDVPLEGRFDAIIFSYYCYAFIPASRRRIAALRKAAALLKPGGHVIVSHSHNARRPLAILVWSARLMGALCQTDWRLEPGDLVWDSRGAARSYSYRHVFEAGEVEREASAASLQPVFDCNSDDGRAVALARG